MNSGIYAIENARTGQLYVGQSVKARQRVLQHFGYLRKGKHQNPHLQRSFDKHGADAFVGRTIVICRPEDLPLYEKLIIHGLKTDERAHGFNLAGATPSNYRHAEETKRRISIGVSARPNQRAPKSEETKRKIAATLTGRVGANKGRKFTPEHRANLAAAKRKYWASPEGRAKMMELLNSPGCLRLSPEVRKKISASLKGRKQSIRLAQKET